MPNSDEWRLNWMISVDDHVLEPPGVWQDRVPPAVRDLAPRHVADSEGEAWLYDGERYPTYGLSAVAGKDSAEFSLEPLTYADMRPGCYDPKARVEEMDQDNVLASLCFPSFPRFAGQLFSLTPNRELGIACVRAYNDWMIDEWCGTVEGRLIPLAIIPMWDPRLAAQEVERVADRGAKAIAFSENPEPLGFPSIHDNEYWDPFLSAVNDSGLPLCSHIGSSSRLLSPTTKSPELSKMTYATVAACAGTLLDWLFSGNFMRFPKLRLCLSEGGIGWMPYILERATQVWEKQRHWSARTDIKGGWGGQATEIGGNERARQFLLSGEPAVEVFRKHIFGCFIDDKAGMDLIEAIGVDNVMVESDYPHSDSNWPETMATIKPQLAALSEEDQLKILQGNAIRLFNFEPARPAAAL
jgi:predicted TIM-barrel fold metal-dependent hydrolase